MRKITDMAVELCEDINYSEEGVTLDIENLGGGIRKVVTHITSAKGAKKLGRPKGIYVTIEGLANRGQKENISKILSGSIKQFIKESDSPFKKLLIVGLGNSRFVADSLGPTVCDNLLPNEKIATFKPSVLGATGVASTETIFAITKTVKPSHVLVVDSLCCHDIDRLGNNFQITNTGITPGSGIGRDNQKIDENFLGVPVIALGVPMVIYQPSLHYVVPKMVDLVVQECADIISGAVQQIY